MDCQDGEVQSYLRGGKLGIIIIMLMMMIIMPISIECLLCIYQALYMHYFICTDLLLFMYYHF